MHFNEALQHCIFRFISGSHQYGTNRPDSDIDYRGVFIAPLESAFDIFKTRFVGSGTIHQNLCSAIEAIENADYANATNLLNDVLATDRGDLNLSVKTVHNNTEDDEMHELRKFMKLAADCNPNIIEFLYVEDLIEIRTPEWEMLRENRDLFLSKKARYTYSGYSTSQFKRIRLHRGYLLNPPTHKPSRSEFGLPEHSRIPPEHQNAVLSLPDELLSDTAKAQVKQERQYSEALKLWNAYCKWDRERNPARKELERKYGFDVKHAYHLIRLSRMSQEILRDGKVIVRRPDAEELRDILNGKWPFERIEEEANALDKTLETLYNKSGLRDKPDRKKIAELYRTICEKRYGIKI